MIELKNIVKKFDEKVVLNNFNYQFDEGKSYAIIGESGSGKTTLLNIIGKLEETNSGSVNINGTDLKNIKEKTFFKDYVGYLFQNYGLIENETIEQNLDLAFVGQKKTKSEKRAIMENSLKEVNLGLALSRKIFSLSGGEAQRVAIAKVIIKNPPIILADEPTASLDEKNSQEVIDLILKLLTKEKIVIIATHNKSVKERLDEVVEVIHEREENAKI